MMSALMVLFAIASCESVKTSRQEKIKTGMTLPDFRAVDTDGMDYTRSKLFASKTPSLIVLFDTQCGDCMRQMPEIQKAYEGRTTGTMFIGIARGADEKETLKFKKEFGITFPLCPDKNKKVYSLFADSIVPRIYISDEHTTVRFIHTDESVASAEELLDEIQKASSYGKDK